METAKPTVFFDRDGVICKHVPYLHRLEDFQMLPGVAESIAALNQRGFLVVVVTNQPMLAMGLLSEQELQQIHQKMHLEISKVGGKIDAVFYCPHSPTDRGGPKPVASLIRNCDCQKPKLGLIQQAQQRFNIDMTQSFMLGDSWRDYELAKNAGLNFLGILGGDGFRETPEKLFPDVHTAVKTILAV